MFKTINGGKTPTKGSKYSACIDLFASEDIMIAAGETAIVGLGVEIDIKSLKKNMIDKQYFGLYATTADVLEIGFNNFYKSHYIQLEPRSSLRAKGLICKGAMAIKLENSDEYKIVGSGVIDLDYPNELKLIVHNPFTGKYNEIMNKYGTGTDIVRKSFTIKKGDKIAQAMLCEHKSYLFGIESEEERTGGIGSTGN